MALRNGKTLLMFNGYTYFYHAGLAKCQRWACSGKTRHKCQMYLHVDNTGKVNFIKKHDHNHPPPVYIITEDGYYVKQKS